jgi:hypothetical protein
MQPDRNQGQDGLPSQPPVQTPYATPSLPEMQRPAPVVTLSSDDVPQPLRQEPPVAAPPLPGKDMSIPETSVSLQEPIHWKADEYIHHEKNLLWFVIFTLVAMAFTAMAIFLIRSLTFAILVPVMAAALLVYVRRPPRLIDYTLSSKGIHINDHLYSFADFKAFGVVRDGAEYSVMLLPTKRFRPGTTIYFPEEAGEAIVDMLGARLPMQELHLDAVDKIIRKLRI